MNVGIVGLGLIGGSAAKAYKKSGNTVLAYDIDTAILDFARMNGIVDETLDENNIGKCELLIIALYPELCIKYLKENAEHISKNTVVIDFCGTKREVCEAGFALAEKHGFVFVGGHPMAGTHHSGFSYSRDNLFKGAGMVVVPPKFDDIELLDRIKSLLIPLEFGNLSAITADKHDEIIAFTSQMPHIISNAYIKSPTAREHKGFSAGSYKDLTRVAWLNPGMWTELFLENKDNLLLEIDILVNELTKYRKAIAEDNREELYKLLDEGKNIKEEVDGR